MSTDPVVYTDIELESYLPAGWTLTEEGERGWNAGERAFRFRVLDGSDLDWTLEVPAAEVEEHGRIEALRRAVDRLNRGRFKHFI